MVSNKSSPEDSIFLLRQQLSWTKCPRRPEIEYKILRFCSGNSSPKDSIFVHGTRAQRTRFLLMEIKPKRLVFCSWNSSPKDVLFSHVTQLKNEQIFTLLHTSQQSLTLKPTPVLSLTLQTQTPVVTLTLPHAAPLRVSNPHWSSQQITYTQTPHRSSQSLSLSSNPNTLKPKHRSSLSLKPRAAPL